MLKHEEVSNPNSCFNKACESEMVFVLLERDPAAAATIRFWIAERLRLGVDSDTNTTKLQEAARIAAEMNAGHIHTSKGAALIDNLMGAGCVPLPDGRAVDQLINNIKEDETVLFRCDKRGLQVTRRRVVSPYVEVVANRYIDRRRVVESKLDEVAIALEATAAEVRDNTHSLNRDWPEDYSDENGGYTNTCGVCGKYFIGHKRRAVCRACSTKDSVHSTP